MSGSSHPPMPPGGGAPVERGGMRWFLPFNEETTISTRGQVLPGLIQSHSTADLDKLRRRGAASPRRGGSPRGSVQFEDASELELGRSQTFQGSSRPQTAYDHFPQPPLDFPLVRGAESMPWLTPYDERRQSVLFTPQMRSQRLIGNSNPRFRWQQYYKTPEELKKMRRPLRKYHERNNYLVQQYMYIDRLLDSSIPRSLIDEYNIHDTSVSATIPEEVTSPTNGSVPNSPHISSLEGANSSVSGNQGNGAPVKVVRTAKNLYKIPAADERTRLLGEASDSETEDDQPGGNGNTVRRKSVVPEVEIDDTESGSSSVVFAIYLNFTANAILLVLKIIVTILTSSVSVLASLVDAALDFLSTLIVWVTTRVISQPDQEDVWKYPVGRRRLEPIGVLVFSVIMVTSFFQVGVEAVKKLAGSEHEVVQLTPSAIAIMATTVGVKGFCWVWCRVIKNSSVQALAQDAATDMVFNTFSIIFPVLGYYLRIWWLDPLGGLLLSIYVITCWSMTSKQHVDNLTGRAASNDERNLLLYLTMRFAKTIKYIQSLQAYHAGDRVNVEVDIVLDENISLRDSHDLGESLQYVLESVPGVERAFVHIDYYSANLPNHMRLYNNND